MVLVSRNSSVEGIWREVPCNLNFDDVFSCLNGLSQRWNWEGGVQQGTGSSCHSFIRYSQSTAKFALIRA